MRRDGQGMYFNTQRAAGGLRGGVGGWSDGGMMVKCTQLMLTRLEIECITPIPFLVTGQDLP